MRGARGATPWEAADLAHRGRRRLLDHAQHHAQGRLAAQPPRRRPRARTTRWSPHRCSIGSEGLALGGRCARRWPSPSPSHRARRDPGERRAPAGADRRHPRPPRHPPARASPPSGGPTSPPPGAPGPRDVPDLRRGVVYLDTAPRAAFDEREPGRAVMDQRNERFVPHVLAVMVGTVVDFPNSDRTYHNVFSLSRAQALRPRPLRRRQVERRCGWIGPASCACSATSTRT